jgi:hypothetical protein
MKENPIRSLPGIPFLLGVLVVTFLAGWLFVTGTRPDPATGSPSTAMLVGGIVLGIFALLNLIGLYTVQPNQAAVVSLFGKYVGTVRENGLRWNNPSIPKGRSASACATSRAASSRSTNSTAARSRSPR